MFIYIVIALVIQALAIGAIVVIEPLIVGWSGIIFMTSYLLSFWLAWVIAVRVTEPRKIESAAAQPSRA
jgi:fatty acid desaturase